MDLTMEIDRHRRYDYKFKIILIGDTQVGKTLLYSRLTQNMRPYNPIPKVNAFDRFLEVDGKTIKAEIWDAAAHAVYQAITTFNYFGDVAGALLVYDITRPPTFENLSQWLKQLRELEGSDKIVIMLVGNKVDVCHLRYITKIAGESFAEQEGVLFFETSAADGKNVEDALQMIIRMIYRRMSKKPIEASPSDNSVSTDEEKGKASTDKEKVKPSTDKEEVKATAGHDHKHGLLEIIKEIYRSIFKKTKSESISISADREKGEAAAAGANTKQRRAYFSASCLFEC